MTTWIVIIDHARKLVCVSENLYGTTANVYLSFASACNAADEIGTELTYEVLYF